MGVEFSRLKMDGSEWEWVGVDGSGWEWMGVSGSGLEWVGARFSITRFFSIDKTIHNTLSL